MARQPSFDRPSGPATVTPTPRARAREPPGVDPGTVRPLPEFPRHVAHAGEARAGLRAVLDEALEHRHAVAPRDDLRMHTNGEQAVRDVLVHPVEFLRPDLEDFARR